MYNALLVPGILNSNPKLHIDDLGNVMYPFIEKHLWVKKAIGLGVTEFKLTVCTMTSIMVAKW
jgi:hypothetical protein